MTTAETRALDVEAAPGVISLSEPDGGNREVDALLEHNGAGREPAKPPDQRPGRAPDNINRRIHDTFVK